MRSGKAAVDTIAPDSVFHSSCNALFEARVAKVERVSPGFRRVTLQGPDLRRFASTGRDQRIKIMLPNLQGVYPPGFVGLAEPLPERLWRKRWRTLDARERPVLRSYTPVAVRQDAGEVDIDVFLHATAGFASTWALQAGSGDFVMISGPDALSDGDPLYGIQWRPGPAESVLLAGDETTFPALRGIVDDLSPGTQAQLIVEVGDQADLGRFAVLPEDVRLQVAFRGAAAGGTVLRTAVGVWAEANSRRAKAMGASFYAWMATESVQVARMRRDLVTHGFTLDRIHTQGYWHDRPRQP